MGVWDQASEEPGMGLGESGRSLTFPPSVPSAQCLEADGLELLPESLLSNYPSGFPDFLCAVELESLLGWSSSALWAGL